MHVDQWLANQGWLTYASGKADVRKQLKQYMGWIKRFLPRGLLLRGRRAFAVNRIIDWAHTRAYSGVASEYAIYINRRDREPYGIVADADVAALRRDCLLYTSDAADELPCVDLVGRRIINKHN